MRLNVLAPLIKHEFDLTPTSRAFRHAYHDVKYRARERNRTTPESLRALSKAWWYYSVELLPDVLSSGAVPSDLPFGPRMLLRKCDLNGMSCVDLGTMEGLVPILMRRRGAKRVLAADASYHCYEKIRILQKQYHVAFDFQQIGLMYDLSKKIDEDGGFDLVVLGGVLYHVFSPLHVLAGLRPLIRENGILIVSTNVVNRPEVSAVFNDRGHLQTEVNTFWYLSIPMLEYALRYFGLYPIDYVYVPHSHTKHRVEGLDSGLMTVACRAARDRIGGTDDPWALRSAEGSWEYRELCDSRTLRSQPESKIRYETKLDPRLLAPDGSSLDLLSAVRSGKTVARAERPQDSYVLHLADDE